MTSRRNGHRGQLYGTGVIADCVNARYAGVLELIDDDITFFVGFTPVTARLKLSFAGSRPIAQIRQSTVWLRPSSSSSVRLPSAFFTTAFGTAWVWVLGLQRS